MVSREVIAECSKGSRVAHQAFYEGTVRYVYATVSRYIYDEEDKRDLVQEAFARIFTAIPTYNSKKGTINNWVRKVTINECLMHLRKKKRLSYLAPIEDIEGQVAGDDPTAALDRLTRTDIEALLANMPDGYRVVFVLSVLDGYDHSEIAELLSIKTETSRSQLTRAKKWIKKNVINQTSNNAYGLL